MVPNLSDCYQLLLKECSPKSHYPQHSNPNEMLSGLRYFERNIRSDPNNQGVPKESFSWGCVDPCLLATCMLSISDQVSGDHEPFYAAKK